MAPTERTPKRQKLSPTEPPSSSTVTPASPKQTSPTLSPLSDGPNLSESNRASWYSRTWPRKAAPITQVARDSVSSASNTAIETAAVIKDKVVSTSHLDNPSRRSSLALTLGKRASSKALPVGATTTIDHAMPEGRKSSRQETPDSSSIKSQNTNTSAQPSTSHPSEPNAKLASVAEATPEVQAEVPSDSDGKHLDTKQEIIAPRSWIGWLARADDGSAKSTSSAPERRDKNEDVQPTVKPAVETTTDPNVKATTSRPEEITIPEATSSTEEPTPANPRRSWLPIWNNATAAQSAPTITSPVKDTGSESAPIVPVEPAASIRQSDLPPTKDSDIPAQSNNAASEVQGGTKPSAWIFWSREKPAETTSLKDVPREGELAVANTETEQRPRRASISADTSGKVESVSSKGTEDARAVIESKKKHESKSSTDTTKPDPKPKPKPTKVQGKGASATGIAPSDVQAPRTASPTPSRKNYDHHLLPLFHETLKLPENPTLLQQLQRLFYSTKEPDLKHINLVKDPPKIKNALVIGVHGYFPAPLIRSVLGQPTGTSIKFADMAAQSIQRWTKKRGYECHVKSAALEGEGKIAERIDLLWKLLLNWIDEIRKSDFIMVACHSQGVPVATMLVAKLIHFGCISAARVGICAMAGVNLGPFPEFKSRWISGSAGELFEFSDPTSKVSTDYIAALEDVLKFGVKITYVGSIDDQLVSLESSIFAPVSHPHLYRAVSIDSRLHAPDFVSHLVAFALKLRNLGVQDHGLIRELSAPLAGSLYSGEGHSRLYEDSAIYDLAVSFTLETTSLTGVPLFQRPVATSGANPFILPFAMRGILEEDFVKSDLQGEASQLLQQFDEWKPITKALKDVKFRLEGIRAKL